MTRTTRMLLVLAACTATLVTATAATAAPARAAGIVSGEYTLVDLGETSCVPLDDVRLRCRTTGLRFVYAGDLDGETTADLEQVIDCASGRTHGNGIERFTGSLRGGTSGTLTWRLWFTSDFDCTTFFPSNLGIVAVITNGTGGLAHTRGLLVFDDTTYRGLLR